jgi:hypothetical protein
MEVATQEKTGGYKQLQRKLYVHKCDLKVSEGDVHFLCLYILFYYYYYFYY